MRPRLPQDVTVIELADEVPVAPGGYGKDLGAVSIATAHTTRTGNYVLVGGFVTVPPDVIGSRDFWIQDTSGGVHVYVASAAGQVPRLQLWENVTVRGRVVSRLGEREVRLEVPLSINLFGIGAPITPPRVQTGALSPAYEGELIEITGVATRVQGQELYLDDGSGEALVYIDPTTHINIRHLNFGDSLRVVGAVRRFHGRAELVPRFPSDLSTEEEQGAKQNAGGGEGNTSEVTPTAITMTPTLTASPSPSSTPTAQMTAQAIRRPAPGATTRTSQAGLSLSDNWEMLFAAVLLVLFSASGGMALTAVWKYRQNH